MPMIFVSSFSEQGAEAVYWAAGKTGLPISTWIRSVALIVAGRPDLIEDLEPMPEQETERLCAARLSMLITDEQLEAIDAVQFEGLPRSMWLRMMAEQAAGEYELFEQLRSIKGKKIE